MLVLETGTGDNSALLRRIARSAPILTVRSCRTQR